MAARFGERLEELLEYHNFVLQQYYRAAPIDFASTRDGALEAAERIRPMVADVPARLHELNRRAEPILFEGAQGSLLDVDQGTFPFVTSSNTTAGGAATGSGLGPGAFDYVLGIAKAYTTRVGGGPFPTELFDRVGAHLASQGHEFGATTGRARRCGWADAVALRRAVRVNGVTGLGITKLDVLDRIETLHICEAYRIDGAQVDEFPVDPQALEHCEPIYRELPGWMTSTVSARAMQDLPDNARAYLDCLTNLAGAPAHIVSTGPERDDAIVVQHPFDA